MRMRMHARVRERACASQKNKKGFGGAFSNDEKMEGGGEVAERKRALFPTLTPRTLLLQNSKPRPWPTFSPAISKMPLPVTASTRRMPKKPSCFGEGGEGEEERA